MKSLGIHLLVEYYDCDRNIINNKELIKNFMVEAVNVCGATYINSIFYEFNPQGITGIILIAESHLSIHTWPEYKIAIADFFTCGNKTKPIKAFKSLRTNLKSKRYSVIDVKRGFILNFKEKNN